MLNVKCFKLKAFCLVLKDKFTQKRTLCHYRWNVWGCFSVHETILEHRSKTEIVGDLF